MLQTLFSNPGLWKNTALFVTYDEHDGFFDHQLPPSPEATVTEEFIGGLPIGLNGFAGGRAGSRPPHEWMGKQVPRGDRRQRSQGRGGRVV